MTLSTRERGILSTIDRELSADPRLRAVAALFAEPPPRHPGSTPDDAPPNRVAPPSAGLVLGVAVLGLACCALTASLHLLAVASAAAILATCAGMAFVVAVVHHHVHTAVDTAAADRPRAGKEIST